jgi:uncharacterized membrane protein YkvA (DUF1232 family)
MVVPDLRKRIRMAINTIEKPNTRVKRREAKGRMRNFLMFLPNMVTLLGRLLKDPRVPTAEKALFLGAIIYVISPIDLLPDILPFIGQVDDIYVVALTLLRLVNRTDETVVREHWSGGGDIVSLADSIAGIAPSVLPKRVSRVLSSEVKLAPAGKILRGIANKGEPVVVEIPQSEDGKRISVDSRSKVSN